METSGHFSLAAIDESSGLAPSRRAKDLLWTHNDSDGQPVLYAIGTDGVFRGSVRLAGVKNLDWEDVDSFELDGRAWLLVAETGFTTPAEKCALYVLEEPNPVELSPEKELTANVAWTVPVRYADGGHDCESVAVDAREGTVFLLLKRERPSRLLTLPLRPSGDLSRLQARVVGVVSHIPQPDSKQRLMPVPTGLYRGNPTSMSFASNGRAAVVLTYGDVLLFKRNADESWAAALSRSPVILPPHGLGQAEAVCFSADNSSLFVSEEKSLTTLLRYRLDPAFLR